jgi:hypothetical protein
MDDLNSVGLLWDLLQHQNMMGQRVRGAFFQPQRLPTTGNQVCIGAGKERHLMALPHKFLG